MIPRLEREHLSSDLAALDELLATTPPGDVLGRISLQERRESVRAALGALEGPQRESGGRTALLFGGGPVLGSRGIEAGFASEALSRYEDLVTKVWSAKEHGTLAAFGPIPRRDEVRLHVTNVLHGSFGFELAELGQSAVSPASVPPASRGHLHDAIRAATRALVAAATSDDEVADVAEDLDARAFAALKEFFFVLRRAHASFRVVADEVDRAFDVREVHLAAERTSEAIRSETRDVPLPGEFLAVLPASHQFEFLAEDGATIRGRVDDELTDEDLRTMNTSWANRACTAHLRVVTVTRRGRSHVRYVLQRLEPAS